MEKDRSARLIAIVALVLAVTGVSIGFAVLSTNLTIEAPEASVKANNKLFTVYFSSNPSSYAHDSVSATLAPNSSEGFTGNEITVTENSATLSGIGGTFTEPGQSITYHLGVSNTSKLNGYLTAITFEKADGATNGNVKCEAVQTNENPLDEGSVANACDNIEIKVTVNNQDYTGSNASITGNSITAGTTEALDVTITYKGTATPTTGDFKATFGKIKLTYETEDNEAV